MSQELERGSFRVVHKDSGSLAELLSIRPGDVAVSIRYTRGRLGLKLFVHIGSSARGTLIDAFLVRDEMAIVSAEMQGLPETTPDEGLVKLAARRLLFRLRSNPRLRVRHEQLAEAQRERVISPQMRLPLPKEDSRDTTSGVLSIFREQEVRGATVNPRPRQEIPATVRVITAEDIRRHGYRYLHELLRDQPGFDVTYMQGLYGSIFSQRGLDQPENIRTLVLIDGVPDNNISQGSAYIKHTYGLEGVRQVEIVSGPASALYGANAMSGVINLVTKSGSDLKGGLEVGFGTTYMEADTRRPAREARLAAGRKFGTLPGSADLFVYGHWIDGAGPILNRRDSVKPVDASYTWTEGYTSSALKDNYAVGLKLRWGYFDLGARITRDYTGQGTFASERAYADDADLAYWHVQTQAYTGRVELPISSKLTEKLRVSYRDTSVVDGTDADYVTAGERLGSITITRYRRPDREISIDNPFGIRWSRSQETSIGFTYTDQVAGNYNTRAQTYPNRYALAMTELPVLPDADPLNKFKYTDRAGYIEHVARPLDSLILTMGFRHDVFEITGADGSSFCGTTEATLPSGAANSYFLTSTQAANAGCSLRSGGQYYRPQIAAKSYTASNPRVGLVYQWDRQLALRGSYGAAFRAPTVRELYSVSGSRTSNEGLEPERIRTAEIGMAYAARTFRLDWVGFHSYVQDMILLAGTDIHRPGRSAGSNLSRFQNAGRAQVDGTELQAEWRFRRVWRFAAAYTYQRARLFDVSDPGLTAHSGEDPRPMEVNNTTICREALERNGLVLLRASCGEYSGNMPRVAANKLQATITFEPKSGWFADLRGNWVDRRFNIQTAPTPSVPSYLLLNASFGLRDWPYVGTELRLRVENVLDSQILDPGFRDGSGSYFPAAHPQPGRWLGWEVSHRLQ